MYCITVDNSPSFKAAILFDTCAHLSAVTAIVSCDCDSPAYKAATLFDRGAHASFVNREVAAWVEGQARRNPGYQRPALHYGVTGGDGLQQPDIRIVVFDLTFFNEVSRLHETIRDIRAQVIDSCIPVNVSRPIIRANHLVRKIPLYFDEGPSSKPDQSQPVEPVTALSTTRARCRGTQTCGTCCPSRGQHCWTLRGR